MSKQAVTTLDKCLQYNHLNKDKCGCDGSARTYNKGELNPLSPNSVQDQSSRYNYPYTVKR